MKQELEFKQLNSCTFKPKTTKLKKDVLEKEDLPVRGLDN